MKKLTTLLLLVFVFASCLTSSAAESPRILAITNGKIIDGTGKPPISHGTVLIQGDRITAVGSSDQIKVPPGAEVINASGKTVLPGIIDSHLHTVWKPEVRRALFTAGITSVCDMGSSLRYLKDFDQAFHEKNPVARGFKAGPIMTAPKGLPDAYFHDDMNYEVSTPEEARKGVADLISKGVDVIKVYLHPDVNNTPYPMLDLEQVRAIVEEAHKRGVLVRAHVAMLSALEIALDGGVDVIEHVPKPPLTHAYLSKKLEKSNDPMKDLYDLVVVPDYEKVLPRMVEQGVILVPTLTGGAGKFYNSSTASPGQKVIAEAVLNIVGRFYKLGGKIALGTDFYKNSGKLGEMQRREMKLLLAAGLPPMEVIKACTQRAALVSGQGKDLGTLERGKLADVILVDGDPLEDLEALGKVVTVIKGGKVGYRAN